MGEDAEKRQRIKLWMGAALVITALTIDLLEMLLEWLGIGLVMTFAFAPAGTFLFWLWFKLLDVPFIASPKKFFTLAATNLAEIIPALDALGGFFWTLGTLIIVIMVRLEDKGGVVGKLSGTAMGIMQKRYKSYKSTFDNPEELKRMKKNLAISKDELAEKARERNPQFNLDQYGRATKMTEERLNNKYAQDEKSSTTKK